MKSKLFLMTMFLIFVQFGMNAQNDVTKTSPDVNNTECTDSISLIEKGNFELLIKKISLSLRDFRWGDDDIYTERLNRLPFVLLDEGEETYDIYPIENLKDIDPESVVEIKIEYGRSAVVYGSLGEASGVIKIKLKQEKK